jgi:acetoin utilization protein AcuA
MGSEQPTRIIQTPRGAVEIISYVQPEQLESWELDPGIGKFSSYRSILTNKESLAEQALDPKANLCLGIYQGKTIVGYCVRRPPPPEERWARLKPPIMFEVFGENARGWRDLGLMKPMLEEVCLEPENERRILYIVAYSWHWDLDYTKKSVQEYRDTIIHLLQPLGFRQYPTNEPNVCLRPENLFMARIGREVEPAVQRRFTNLLFGIVED